MAPVRRAARPHRRHPRDPRLVDLYATQRILLTKATVTLYEDVQEFWVATRDEQVVGCGALHVLWDDLAEVRTLAVDPSVKGEGIGHLVLDHCWRAARSSAFAGCSASPSRSTSSAGTALFAIDETPVELDVYEELLQSYDEGVAEFLDLERVKPNTFGNTRMLLQL